MIIPRVIAFYLPQFHPIPENDEWWGKGFTEWTNVGKAKPLFKGHDQPRVPTELGYYDLRLPDVREAQAQMARDAGIEGFMYWHYWFGNGRTLMADIFQNVLESGKPDFPFALGWANHSWYSKTWNSDGTSSNKLLAEQTYPGYEDAKMYFDSLLKAFQDSRYIKVDGRPLFYIFDPVKLPDSYIGWFNQWAKEAGFPGLYLVANIVTDTDKNAFIHRGFSAVTYQRLSSGTPKSLAKYGRYGRYIYRVIQRIKGYLKNRPPRMEEYKDAIKAFVTDREKENDVIPTIVPRWDHTPRSGWNGSLLVNSTPHLFYNHALEAFRQLSGKPLEKQLVFLKSWNEWGEGNYMEPDIRSGRGYINSLSRAINDVKEISVR